MSQKHKAENTALGITFFFLESLSNPSYPDYLGKKGSHKAKEGTLIPLQGSSKNSAK